MPRSKITVREIVLLVLCTQGKKRFGELVKETGYSKASISYALNSLTECIEYIDGYYIALDSCCKNLRIKYPFLP